MEEEDFSFDFESKLEEQQRKAAQASASTSAPNIPPDAAVSVNQSAGSFKRNFRQVTCQSCQTYLHDPHFGCGCLCSC